ncbi:MAG: leucine export protein LeuE [Methanocella sp. PtaU1.Bin125]|nr:MAG: leucine export protein LeuE [Methanocella sp. PtaU1.Bin125]
MSDLSSIVAGIALGLSLGVPPGPVNAAIAAAAARRSYLDGIKVGLGAMTADFTYLVLTVIGVAVLLTGSLARDAISVIGGLILVYFACATLKSYRQSRDNPENIGTGNHYLMGLVMGLTNPLGILWWVTAGAAFVAMFNVLGVAGFMLGLLAWISCFSVFVHYAGKKVDLVYPIIVIGSGLMMLFFGLVLLYDVAAPAISSFL